jgi:hypothetical protein
MKKTALLFTLIYFTVAGCNPARRIIMKNSSADTAQFIWTTPEDSIGTNPFVMHNSKELKFVLPPGKKDVSLSFGIGSWSPEYMQRFIRYLVSLEIIGSGHSSKLLSTPEEISSFLMTRRKGSGKTKIEIIVTGQ